MTEINSEEERNRQKKFNKYNKPDDPYELIRTGLLITRQQEDFLEEIKYKSDKVTSKSELIREAINDLAKKYGYELQKKEQEE